MTKASDNAFPSILITEGTEPSAPAAGKQRLYIDSTTHHLTRTNSSGTETDIETAAAGAPSSAKYVVGAADGTLSQELVIPEFVGHPDIPPTSPNAVDDEFDAGSLDAKWTQTGSSTNTFGSSRMSVTIPSASEVSFYQSFSPGASTAFTIRAKFTGMTFVASTDYVGLQTANSSGTAIAECSLRFATGMKWHKDNPGGSADATPGAVSPDRFWMEMSRDTSDVYSFKISFDGRVYSTLGLAGGTSSTTVARLYFRFGQTAATTYKGGSIDWIRRTV